MARIFLSHSNKEQFEVCALCDWLVAEGWNDVFLELDPRRGVAVGERWERKLYEATNACEAVIFLVSRNWLDSVWCRKEYEVARGLNKKLFAALNDASMTVSDLPPELTGVWQAVSLKGGQDHKLYPTKLPGGYEEQHVAFSQSGLLRLKRGLIKAGLSANYFSWPPEGNPDRSPYRGLKPFEAEDAGVFFGRDAPIVEAIDRLRGLSKGAPPRLFTILGASGAGKSSFLRAGLLPRLARDDSHFLSLLPIRPERAAISGETGLIAALAAAFPKRGRAELRAKVLSGAAGLKSLLAELVSVAIGRRVTEGETYTPPLVCIAIDQAEELFRLESHQESQRFLELVRELVRTDDPAVVVVFAIRSDAYDALENAKELAELRQVTQPLLPLPGGAYKDVIEGPARRVEESGGKLAIDPQLTERLLADLGAGGADALPLLAFTLEQLYVDHGPSGSLQLANYATADSDGLHGVIESAVERAFRRADLNLRIPVDRAAREILLRRGLIPWLAGIDPDSKKPRRNIARRSEIPAEAAPLIDLLVEERLLSADIRRERAPDGGQSLVPTIEPTHEALLRQWGMLDGWLKDDFALLVTLEAVKRAASEWDANARKPAWLAHREQRLLEAASLAVRADLAARLDKTDHDYIADCKANEAKTLRRSRAFQGAIYTLLSGIIVGLAVWINQGTILRVANWYFVMQPYMLKHVRPYVLRSDQEKEIEPGKSFHECDGICPEMMVIGRTGLPFQMGSNYKDSERFREGPPHPVTISQPFAVSIHDVTFEEWDTCIAVGGCPPVSDAHMGRGKKPAVHMTWEEARVYAAWWTRMTGKSYRLLSEAEWEYSARAGTTTTYYWGESLPKEVANCIGCNSRWANKETSPVGSFPANNFGLTDMYGNVWQWVEDCYNSTYERSPSDHAPNDGSAWMSGDCDGHVARGGSWDDVPELVRATARVRVSADDRNSDLGFRVARSIKRDDRSER